VPACRGTTWPGARKCGHTSARHCCGWTSSGWCPTATPASSASSRNGLRISGSGRLTGNLRYLFRAGCYFNSPVPTGSHLAWLRQFQRFSQIGVTATNDYTTWAQLLVSSGDTNRPATGCDCITEITPARGQELYAAGYRIVGRYLDEHRPPDDPYFRNKALKPGEPQAILDAGLRLLPIFQYNGTQLSNFTYQKGYDQAAIAHRKC
jgi:hypothetical protein